MSNAQINATVRQQLEFSAVEALTIKEDHIESVLAFIDSDKLEKGGYVPKCVRDEVRRLIKMYRDEWQSLGNEYKALVSFRNRYAR